ncbi:MAG: type II toxin-antitoxin system VapC family toxin [Bryobacteraceae bacterium]
MAQYFFDDSAFVKYYHTELGSQTVTTIFAEPNRLIRVSSLGVLETQSVFAMKVRAGELDRKAAGTQRAMMMLDIAAGSIAVHALRPDHLTAAERLIGRYGFLRPLKTLDALQLAIALELSHNGLLDAFIVADKRLSEVASVEGLTILNPESQ